MSRVCQVCEKSYLKGNSVPRGIGRRVTNRAIRKQQPNLRTKRLTLNGQTIKLSLCASCLKRIKFDKKKLQENTTESTNTTPIEGNTNSSTS